MIPNGRDICRGQLIRSVPMYNSIVSLWQIFHWQLGLRGSRVGRENGYCPSEPKANQPRED